MESYAIKNLTFAYPQQDRKVLDNISVTIESGQFVVLCGPSGSGKTTLLRHLKPVLTPHGTKTGSITFEGHNLYGLDKREQTSKIGFVLQSPDNQLVTDKVWHELAFGLESLGYDTPKIRLRVAEMASFFGIEKWFYNDVNTLSGGQKQILNLAAIMAMQPSVLILDEPTGQLDPIATSDFLETVEKINRELGTTIILTEHRLEDALPMADRVIVMDDGKIIADGSPKEVGSELGQSNHKMFLAMPVPMRVYAGVDNDQECPITVREGRQWLDDFSKENEIGKLEENIIKDKDKILNIDNKNRNKRAFKDDINDNRLFSVEIKEAWFKYEKESTDVVKGVSLKAYPGELLAILGGNGTGKTTTLSLISGINRPYRGSVLINGKELSLISDNEKYNGLLGVLPQNPESLFVKKTIKLDLYEMFKSHKLSKADQERRVDNVTRLCDLTHLLEQHPYDLSGGEQQRVALAKILLLKPKILLLDEPTKGMDAEFKQRFAGILKKLLSQNITVIMVSHDIEFCGKYADRCALFFDGSIVTEGPPREFFSGNSFYTTAANRMSRHILGAAITAEDVIEACGGELDDDIDIEVSIYGDGKSKIDDDSLINVYDDDSMDQYYKIDNITEKENENGNPEDNKQTNSKHTIDKQKTKYSQDLVQIPPENRKLSKRTIVASVIILLLIPLTIFIGTVYFGDRKYYFISLLIILEIMIPFVLVFEGRKPKARELVLISVLCAIGVVSRAAFYMIPQFTPITAIVIITGVALGGESGFLVGAITMFLSNIMLGQGPWTPWQMFAMGIIGFLAGILFRKGFLRRDRVSLTIFGAISVFLIYGGIMNPASVIMYQSKITWPMIVTSYIAGAPMDLIHAGSTAFFLFIIGEPMLEKLDRVKEKYGLL